MLNETYNIFKSGTDIRGVASEGVADQPVNLTDDVIERMAAGFVLWAEKKLGKPASALTISVGRDCRNCGLSSTPSMFMTTVDFGCDAAVQITASHHPFNRNGLKFFTRGGGLDGVDIEAILEHAQADDKPAPADGSVEKVNYMARYSAHLRDIICRGVNAEDYAHPLKGFHIVVDAGNGAGGFYASEVLEPLGAYISGSVYLDPDGMFPNHIPNPENETAMQSICQAVLSSHADLGVIFDTDVDRGAAVDASGKEILGGKHYRYRRGYKNVINKAQELTAQGIEAPLAIETSGHAAMKENYYLDDGAYLCTRIIIKLAQLRREGKTLESLLAALREPVEACELRLKITDTDFRAAGERVISALEAYAQAQDGWHIAPDNREGIRVSFDKNDGDGWFLLRLSVHDPILPLNIESDSEGGVELIKEKVLSFLKTQSGVEV